MDTEQYDQLDADDLSDYDYQHGLTGDQMSFDYYEDDELPDQLESHSLLRSLWSDCTLPILSQSLLSSSSLILLSLILPILCIVRSPPAVVQLSSFCLGLAASVVFFPDSWQLLVGIGVCFGLLFVFASAIFPSSRSRTAFLSASLLASAVHFELSLDASKWHTLRGPAQLVAMKLISLAIDGESPRFDKLFGYLFCPGTLVFGPWIKYSDYMEMTSTTRIRRISLFWIWGIFLSLTTSFLALFASVCLASFLFSELHPPASIPATLVTWMAAYRDAFSFRFSHYYVCFTSRATLMAAGACMEVEEEEEQDDDEKKNKNNSNSKNYLDGNKNGSSASFLDITSPLKVELPRSLVEVVVHWNIPIHRWLKNYVFGPVRPIVGTPLAILATYSISALLHGLNFQLAAVLLSLGLYSYIEHVLRAKLARIFDACVQARACRSDCQHAHQSRVFWVRVTNLFFGTVAVFHLAYLGVGFDSNDEESRGYSMNHVLGKWGKLGFSSHIVALAFLALSIIV